MLHRKWEAYSFGWICGVSSSLGWSLHSREDIGTGVRSGTEASEGRKLTQGLMYRGGLSYHRCVHDWLVKSSFPPKRSLNKTTKLAPTSEAGEVEAAHDRVAKHMTFRGWLIFPHLSLFAMLHSKGRASSWCAGRHTLDNGPNSLMKTSWTFQNSILSHEESIWPNSQPVKGTF